MQSANTLNGHFPIFRRRFSMIKFRFLKLIFSPYVVGLIITTGIFFLIMVRTGFSFSIPFTPYSGEYADAIFTGLLVKSIVDGGSTLTNSFLGFPGGYALYSFPMDEWLNLAIITLETYFSKNYVVVENSFYFITFLLTTLTSLYTAKKLALSNPWALLVSVLFAFAPYHFLRQEPHLFLSAYYAIPFYLLLIMAVIDKGDGGFFSFFLTDGKHAHPIKKVFLIILILLFASTGVYYAFFTCYFLVIAAIYAAIQQRTWQPFIKAGLFIFIIGLAVLINTAPEIMDEISYGPNMAVATRSPGQAQDLGLKITQMLLPSEYSGFSFLQSLQKSYNAFDPFAESRGSSLGIVGVMGFLFLMFIAVFNRTLQFFDEKIQFIATLNLTAVLFGTMGGFGTLFAYLVSPMIRGYNRISIFISYFALLGFALLLQSLFQRYNRKPLYVIVLAIAIGVIGIVDQAKHYLIDYGAIHQQFESDTLFIQQIEKIMPKNAAIFQLPYSPFPEDGGVNKMADYELLRAYLHSQSLKWSAGAMKGRPIGEWQKRVSQLPASKLLRKIAIAGFSGLYINRNGYEDNGKAIENNLMTILQQKPLENSTKELLFFDLRPYIANMTFSPKEKKETWEDMSFYPTWGEGFYPLETSNNESWHWSEKHSTLYLLNTSDKPLKITLTCQLQTNTPDFHPIWIQSKEWKKTFLVNNNGKDVVLSLVVLPGKNIVNFSTDAPPIRPLKDPRELYFNVRNVAIYID